MVEGDYRETIRNQGARHKHGSSTYQNTYLNRRINAVVQDAFLRRGTKSPYLNVLNHLGLKCDEGAPTTVYAEIMEAIGPDATVR